MKITASVAISSDGYMDDTTPKRLVLSDEADWREVHLLRAECDAILVGAETVRRDNPSLVLRSDELRNQRVAAGKPADIIKVVVSGRCNLSPDLRFFTEGTCATKIVITSKAAPIEKIAELSRFATIIILPEITAHAIAASLTQEGIESLLVEGGAEIIKMFIDEEMLNRLRLAVSPLIVNDCEAPRLPYFGDLPFENAQTHKTTRQVGKMTVYDYTIKNALSTEDSRHLQRAIDISRLSPPCDTAYRVGCVIVTSSGKIYEGYTHETATNNHAEEEAILKALACDEDLCGATAYTSMEPCSTRKSKPVSCSELLIKHHFSKVVYAYAEPDCFVCCEGTQLMRNAGIDVIEAAEYSPQVIAVNSHIINL